MLQITIPEREAFDSATSSFVYMKKEILQLEHSLVSLSKWESKWCKPFIEKTGRTREELIDYIRCMTITQNVNPDIYLFLTNEIVEQVEDYINAKMTATWFNEKDNPPKTGEIITSELIYYWMVALNIPFECQKWHLTRLLTLIRVCNIKSKPPKKLGRKEMLSKRHAMNEARKAKYNTHG